MISLIKRGQLGTVFEVVSQLAVLVRMDASLTKKPIFLASCLQIIILQTVVETEWLLLEDFSSVT